MITENFRKIEIQYSCSIDFQFVKLLLNIGLCKLSHLKFIDEIDRGWTLHSVLENLMTNMLDQMYPPCFCDGYIPEKYKTENTKTDILGLN